ncbi:cation transporter/ATPase [Rhizophagus diaphanus]|nr:cation transporter/ATPase [Rhizophagus diaphanus] [Rhizophagus sp. MUCL 43196]
MTMGQERLSICTALPVHCHILSINQVAEHTKTDIDDGLTAQEATQRLGLYGFNELSGQDNISAFGVLLRQLTNGLMLILVIAMIFAFVFKDYVEGGSFSNYANLSFFKLIKFKKKIIAVFL